MKNWLLGGAALVVIGLSSGHAMAADAYAEATHDWSGFYLGANVGYGWANFDGCIECAEESASFASDLDLSGVVGGVHGGFNYQVDSVVFGVEGDFSFTGFEDLGLVEVSDDEYIHGKVDSMASIRARLGFAVDEALFYVTGGVAYQDGELTSCRDCEIDDTLDDLNTADFSGWGAVVGGGIEYAATEKISVRAEGLYFMFDASQNVDEWEECSGGGCQNVGFDDAFVARIGASWHLGGM